MLRVRSRWGLVLIVLSVIVSIVYGARLSWWTAGCGAGTGAENTGFTAGQTVVGQQDEGTYGFWWDQPEPILCISIDTDTWDLDSVDILEAISMMSGEQITVNNCGNCHENYGLVFNNSSPLSWDIGYSPESDRFVIRAKITEETIAPVGYDHSRDYIKDIVTWAHGVSFGTDGFAVPPGQDRYLWLQFVAPDFSDEYGENQLSIILSCQIYLY